MIFYGTRVPHLRTEPLPGLPCPSCRASNSLQVSVYGRYAHVYWIPVFPLNRVALTECTQCRHAWEMAELPAELKPAVTELAQQVPRPRWHWAGAVLLFLGLVAAFWAARRDREDNATFLKHPKAGDVYTVKVPDDRDSTKTNYSLLKVRSVGGNVVELVSNNYETDSNHPIDNLNDESKYSTEPFSLTLLDLQIMERKGTITDVDRP